MTYISQTTSSINFEGLQMKLIRQKINTMPNVVSIFMASQCGIYFNIRKVLTDFLIFQKNNIRKWFSYIKNNFRKYFFDIWIYFHIKIFCNTGKLILKLETYFLI